MQKYNKTNWVANETLVAAENLNKIEKQLELLTQDAIYQEAVNVTVSNTLDNKVDLQIFNNAKNNFNEHLDNIEINKASKQELDSQKARIDLLTKLQNEETDGNSELLDIRNGVNGIKYNLSGDAVRDSLSAIYNGFGGVFCKDICNLTQYSGNVNFGTIKNENTIIANTSLINIVPSNETESNKTYLILSNKELLKLTTVSITEGVNKDLGLINKNMGLITPTNDAYKIYVSYQVNPQDNIEVYLIDVSSFTNKNEIFNYFNMEYVNNWYFGNLNGIVKFENIVRNVGKVDEEKLWGTDTWTKIDDTTINLPYDTISTITIKKDLKLGSKYAILFTGIIKEIKTINSSSGSWTNIGVINNNVGLINIENECSSLQLITGSSGKQNVYCIDITENIELENFVIKYGIQALDCDYKAKIYKKILDTYNAVTSLPTTESTWYGKKWIAYGDSITEQNSYTQKVAKALGLKLINRGMGGTTVADQDGNNRNAFCRNERIDTFDSDADLVTIMGTTNDWDRSEMGDLTYNNGFDTTKVKGALATTIIKIQKRCPNATIVVCSPIGGRYTQGGINGDIPLVDRYGKSTYDLAKACEEVAEFMGVHYCNTWACGINNWNRIDNIEDAVHPTQDKGTDKIAIKLIGTLKSIAPLI